jgi:hypothetical protein
MTDFGRGTLESIVARADIPQTLEDLTPAWMTAALRSRGVLARASVARVEREVIGEGEGYTGVVARLRLTLDRPEADAPASLIVKLPTTNDRARAGTEMLGCYEREIRFYEELAPALPIRVPRCYLGALDPGPGGDSERVIGAIDRLPRPLLAGMLRLAGWLAARSRRRYVLLLEDLAPAVPGDQVGTCPPERLGAALRTLGALHGALWRSPLLEGRRWLTAWDTAPRLLHVMYRRGRPLFERIHGAMLSPRCHLLADWLDAHGVALVRRLARAPETLVHGDFRLDNLLFRSDAEAPWVADWQIMSRGPGVYDAACLLSGALEPEVGAEEETALLREYHRALEEAGVTDYPFARCHADYRRAVLLMLQRLLSLGDSIEFDSARGRALIEGWLRRLAGRLVDVQPDALLGAHAP